MSWKERIIVVAVAALVAVGVLTLDHQVQKAGGLCPPGKVLVKGVIGVTCVAQ